MTFLQTDCKTRCRQILSMHAFKFFFYKHFNDSVSKPCRISKSLQK